MVKQLLAMCLMAPLYGQTAEQLEARGTSVANVRYQGRKLRFAWMRFPMRPTVRLTRS